MFLMSVTSCIDKNNSIDSDFLQTTRSEKSDISLSLRLPSKDDSPNLKELIYSNLGILIINDQNKIENRIFINYKDSVQRGISEAEFVMTLTGGKKIAYVLANINESSEYYDIISNAEIGSLANIDLDKSIFLPNIYDIEDGLPMSGFSLFEVTTGKYQRLEIELIRLLSKINLRFFNYIGLPITLEKINLFEITNHDIFLFPKSLFTNIFPANQTEISPVIIDFNKMLDKSEEIDTTFYINESTAKGISKRLSLKTFIKYDETLERPYLNSRYSLFNFGELKRNDFLSADIIFVDYKIRIDIESVIINNSSENDLPKNRMFYDENNTLELNNQYASEGLYIYPRLIKLSTDESMSNKDYVVELEDNSGVFKTQLLKSENNSYYVEINSDKNGVAKIKFTIAVKDDIQAERYLEYELFINKQKYE